MGVAINFLLGESCSIRRQVKAAEAALLPGVRQELSDARKHISSLQQERDDLQVVFLSHFLYFTEYQVLFDQYDAQSSLNPCKKSSWDASAG